MNWGLLSICITTMKLSGINEQALEEKRKQEQDEVINAVNGSIVEDKPTPKNGVQLISMASSQYKMDINAVQALLGKSFAEIQADYKPEYWELIVKSQEGKNETK